MVQTSVLTAAVTVSAVLIEPAPAGASGTVYRVGPGDVLRVEAFQHAEISGSFQVEENGDISFPLLGHVRVAGSAPSVIAALLEEKLERDYYVDVQLQVEVAEYRSQPVTVLGEVQRPGTYYLKGPTEITQVLAEAGGLGAKAGVEVELRRNVVENGQQVQRVYSIPTADLLSGEVGAVVLRAGDVLSVPARQLYFISGEVARPGQYEIAEGMTLMQAISQAGGIGKFASQGVELHREIEGTKEILDLDLSRIRKGKDPDAEIRPGDVVIVKRRFF